MRRRLQRRFSFRLFAGALALLALLSHGVATIRHAVVMAASAPAAALAGGTGISADLAADLAVTCHGGRAFLPDDGGGAPKGKSSACPLCKSVCGTNLAAPEPAFVLAFESGGPIRRWTHKAAARTDRATRFWPFGRGPPAAA